MENFLKTKDIWGYIYLDETNKKWTIPIGSFKKRIDENRIYSFSDILNVELIEDGNSISKGGIGRAIVGGALFGGVGAIVGATTGHKHRQTCSKLQIKITLKNLNIPIEYISLINTETKKDSFTYKHNIGIAEQIFSVLQIICEQNKSNKECLSLNTSQDNIEELKKYKKLLDIGAINQEEFEIKKKELLNL